MRCDTSNTLLLIVCFLIFAALFGTRAQFLPEVQNGGSSSTDSGWVRRLRVAAASGPLSSTIIPMYGYLALADLIQI